MTGDCPLAINPSHSWITLGTPIIHLEWCFSYDRCTKKWNIWGISSSACLKKKKIPRLLQLILHPVCYSEKAEQILWVYRQKISYQCHRLSAQMSVIPLPTIPSNMCTILTIQSNGSLPKICWVFPHWFSIVHESFFFSPGATTPIGGCILQPSGGL